MNNSRQETLLFCLAGKVNFLRFLPVLICTSIRISLVGRQSTVNNPRYRQGDTCNYGTGTDTLQYLNYYLSSTKEPSTKVNRGREECVCVCKYQVSTKNRTSYSSSWYKTEYRANDSCLLERGRNKKLQNEQNE